MCGSYSLVNPTASQFFVSLFSFVEYCVIIISLPASVLVFVITQLASGLKSIMVFPEEALISSVFSLEYEGNISKRSTF